MKILECEGINVVKIYSEAEVSNPSIYSAFNLHVPGSGVSHISFLAKYISTLRVSYSLHSKKTNNSLNNCSFS